MRLLVLGFSTLLLVACGGGGGEDDWDGGIDTPPGASCPTVMEAEACYFSAMCAFDVTTCGACSPEGQGCDYAGFSLGCNGGLWHFTDQLTTGCDGGT